jgi:SatD family (SatD)
MKSSASATSAAGLIGDVVGSRSAPDRARLHRVLKEALETAADNAITAPALTVGDEFQGAYPSVGAAIDAALSVRLALAPTVDVRFGIGWGEMTLLDAVLGIQDGPGWWAARDAIEWTATVQSQAGLSSVRTAYRCASSDGPDAGAVNAALMCRDHLLGSLDDRGLRIIRGLRAGRSKKELAMVEGISASAISQRAGRDGLDLIVPASQQLHDV